LTVKAERCWQTVYHALCSAKSKRIQSMKFVDCMTGTRIEKNSWNRARHCGSVALMGRRHAPLASIRRPSLPLFFGLLALAVQCFVIQTHIHIPAWEEGRGHRLTVDDGAPIGVQALQDQYPPGQDSDNCPLCQELVHFGHGVLPLPAVLSLLLLVGFAPLS
jgi:hypothetical protein